MKKDGIIIGKIPLGKRKVKADFKKIFETIVKTGIMAATGSWANAAKEFAGVISAIGLKREASEIAYYFILEALINTAHRLMEENQWRFRRELTKAKKLYDSEEYIQFLNGFDQLVDEKEIVIGPEFLKAPDSLEVIPDFQEYFKQALCLFGLTPKEAELISQRIPSYFVYEVNDNWRKNAGDYADLLKKIETPFSDAVSKEQEWQAYRAWLEFQTQQPVFEEAFSLKDIFIPLRAYYEMGGKDAKEHLNETETTGNSKKKVDWLETMLEQWLREKKPKDEIKMISGGPGSGKSSFAKIWAAKVAAEQQWQVLFIPLHLFDIHGSIGDALGKYLIGSPHIPFTYNPLEVPKPKDRFLLIFDGLDELVMQGKTARDSASEFIDALERHCTRFNNGETSNLKILIAGRPISVQNADSRLRGSRQQVIHLLPYFLTKEEAADYEDKEKRLKADQRQDWWKRYQQFKELPQNGLPAELKSDNLDNLTREPLLNYLIALSWSFNPKGFGKETNINEVYYNLMRGVYKRDYEGRTYSTVGNLNEDQFFQILEQIAICAWHGGDVRVTTERKIEKHIEERGLKRLLEEYKDSVKGGVSRLLTAFYFRKYGKDEGSEDKDETFEFTHKSFGEYLTARAIVELVKQLYAEIQDFKNNRDSRRTKGWTLQEGLAEWLRICGPTLFDNDLKQLVLNEIQLRYTQAEPEPIPEWQLMLCELIAEVAETGMPFLERYDHKQERQLAQNAEIALLILLHACAQATGNISQVKWVRHESFWEWWHGLYGQVNQYVSAFSVLSKLDVSNQYLEIIQWLEANLHETDLQGADLQWANLHGADLKDANLHRANLQEANLRRANLPRADLRRADLHGANLHRANLHRANLHRANLQEANLHRANLQGAILQGANLQGAILQGAILQGAILQGAILQGAILQGANLQGANLQGAILQGANLQEAIDLTFQQLSSVHSLWKCTGIPDELRQQLEREYPHLFEKPAEYEYPI